MPFALQVLDFCLMLFLLISFRLLYGLFFCFQEIGFEDKFAGRLFKNRLNLLQFSLFRICFLLVLVRLSDGFSFSMSIMYFLNMLFLFILRQPLIYKAISFGLVRPFLREIFRSKFLVDLDNWRVENVCFKLGISGLFLLQISLHV